jgi:homoaconitase/3-isopropylmalate dehydratase large subunit
MTPKEKAIDLITNMQIEHDTEKRCYYFHMSLESAKRSSLIAVDEIINFIEDDRKGFNWKTYYKEVKQEIQKI